MRVSQLLVFGRYATLALPVLGIAFAVQVGCTFSDPPPTPDSGADDSDADGIPDGSTDAKGTNIGDPIKYYGYNAYGGEYGVYGYGYGYGCVVASDTYGYGYDGYDAYGNYAYDDYGYGYAYGYGYGCN